MKMTKVWGFDSGHDGIFETLFNTFTGDTAPEWLTSDSSSNLDLLYYLERSGDKIASPLLDRLASVNTDFELTDAQRERVAKIAWLKYADKWARMYEVETAEFDPIENYNMEEKETPDITKTHGGTTTREVSDDFALTETVTTDTDVTVSSDNEAENSVYGFQNAVGVPANSGIGNTTTRTTGDSEHNIVSRTTGQTGDTTETLDYTDTESGTRSLTRHGNIGVTTSQQMLTSSIELWGSWNFYDSIMADIDSLLTLSIYNYNKYERV